MTSDHACLEAVAAELRQLDRQALGLLGACHAYLEDLGRCGHIVAEGWKLIRTAADTTGQHIGTARSAPARARPRDCLGDARRITPAIAAGTVLVGAFRDPAQVFCRSRLVAEACRNADFLA